MPEGDRSLNVRQYKFIDAYLEHGNATRAVKEAGYSCANEDAAAVAGSRLISNRKVIAEIDRRRAENIAKTGIKAQDVLNEIQKLAFVNLSKAYGKNGKIIHPNQMPEDLQASLQSIETTEITDGFGVKRRKIGESKKIKTHDKLKALELLAKHFKLLTEVTELQTKDDKPLVVIQIPGNTSEK